MGMSLPVYDGGIASGLLSGILFGYVLENAGFASPRKLTAQFRFTDWSVFKVMFTAVIVAAIGLYTVIGFGLMSADGIYIPTTFFWATLTGGALVGAGMAVGGYCPGTSTVGLASGRLDGLFFMVGMVLGTGLFAAVFEPIEGFYLAAQGPQGQTLPMLFGLPAWAVLLALAILAAAGFVVGSQSERARGGPLTAEQLNGRDGDRKGELVEEIEIVRVQTG
jgi:hypothetical protein